MNIIDRALCIGALATFAAAPVEAQNRALGDWHGVLTTPTGQLTVLVQIRQGAGGGQ